MAGAAQRDRAPRDASGGHSRSRLGRRAWPVGRHPVRGAVIGGGGTPPRRTRCRRDRARRDRVRALLEWRPDRDGEHVGDRSSRADHHTGGPAPTACGLQSPPLRHRRRPYLLRAGLNRPLPTLREVEPAARTMGLQIQVFNANTSREIDAAFESMERERADALFVASTPFLNARAVQLTQLANFHRLPAIYGLREHAEAGGLISYGSNVGDAFRQAGVY